MKLFVYKEGLCDPAKGFGIAKQFANAKDLDDFLNFFVVSIAPAYLFRYRAFITNDEVDWPSVDHFSLHGEPIGIVTKSTGKIQEVPIPTLWKDLISRLPKKDGE